MICILFYMCDTLQYHLQKHTKTLCGCPLHWKKAKLLSVVYKGLLASLTCHAVLTHQSPACQPSGVPNTCQAVFLLRDSHSLVSAWKVLSLFLPRPLPSSSAHHPKEVTSSERPS